MADPSSSGVEPRAEWRRRLAGAALIVVGVAGVAAAGWVYYDAWTTRAAWDASAEAQALAQQAAEPTPIWVAPATPGPVSADNLIQPGPGQVPARAAPAVPLVGVAPVATVSAADLSLDATDFRFLDPPEPGAHARVAIGVTNHGATTSSPVLLGVPAKWFEGYRIIGTAPAVSDDRTDDSGLRTFSFPPILSGAAANYELHVAALGEGTTPPAVKVLLANGDLIGKDDKPKTLAPTPRPGPVMSVEIPRLKLKSGVVQTAWEPPPFTIGQLKDSANITSGNTVLIGHLTGAAGNIFSHLDQLKPGDEVTAVSRGLPYGFVVSRTFEAPNNDATPMQPADDARLTLMTCAGVWNPFTHDYSDRLWVVAEPPDRAAVTIANAQATATAQATAAAQATASAEATLAAEPTATAVVVPTPYAGEPSLAGGIGNTRRDLEKAFGAATGETSGKLVVFQPGLGASAAAGAIAQAREIRVAFTPDPPRATLVTVAFSGGVSFEVAVRESRKLFPSDARPRSGAPEGNPQFIVERFASANLEQALGTGDFSVLYTRDNKGQINTIVFGLGDDLDALFTQSRR